MEKYNSTSSDSPLQNNNNSKTRSPVLDNNSPSIHLHLDQNYESIILTQDIITTKIPEKKHSHLNPQTIKQKNQLLLNTFEVKHIKVMKKTVLNKTPIYAQRTLEEPPLTINDYQRDNPKDFNQKDIRIFYININGLDIGNDNHSLLQLCNTLKKIGVYIVCLIDTNVN